MQNKSKPAISCDAVILAGGGKWRYDRSVPNKTFLKIKKRPLFISVLDALIDVERLNKIFIVGPKEKILEEMTVANYPKDKVEVAEEYGNIVDNVWHPFLSTLKGYSSGDENNDKELKDKNIFVTSGDSPLITSMEINEFLDGCEKEPDVEWYMGMTPKSLLEYYEPKDGKRGIKMQYSHFAEGILKINNLHILKPFRIDNKQEFYEFYQVRHLQQLSNVLKSGYGLVKRNLDANGLLGWFEMLLAMNLRKYGFAKLSKILDKQVPLARGERVVSKLMGAKSRAVMTSYGGSALDVDKKGNIEVIEEMFDEWMEHQKSLVNR